MPKISAKWKELLLKSRISGSNAKRMALDLVFMEAGKSQNQQMSQETWDPGQPKLQFQTKPNARKSQDSSSKVGKSRYSSSKAAFLFYSHSHLDKAHPQTERGFCLSQLIQILTSSKNTLTDTPSLISYQTSPNKWGFSLPCFPLRLPSSSGPLLYLGPWQPQHLFQTAGVPQSLTQKVKNFISMGKSLRHPWRPFYSTMHRTPFC